MIVPCVTHCIVPFAVHHRVAFCIFNFYFLIHPLSFIQRILRRILFKPISWASKRFSSKPDKERIFKSLDALHEAIISGNEKKGLVIPFNATSDRFIIFSDQHKGARNGADDFAPAEKNYLDALAYYQQEDYFFINLGDSEELWENTLGQVKKHNAATFTAEKAFIQKDKHIKIFGNHDLLWANDPLAGYYLKNLFGQKVPIHEGVILTTIVNETPLQILCTHGHQGDLQSDGNWFSKFFVSRIWAPLQSYLSINPNSPAFYDEVKSLHNSIMYQWSALHKDIMLITGHTHQPVFASLTHLERLYKQLQYASKNNQADKVSELEDEIKRREREYKTLSVDYLTMKPGYFNSGCCCYSDGDITGLEISNGWLRLVKWKKENGITLRIILEEMSLTQLAEENKQPLSNTN